MNVDGTGRRGRLNRVFGTLEAHLVASHVVVGIWSIVMLVAEGAFRNWYQMTVIVGLLVLSAPIVSLAIFPGLIFVAPPQRTIFIAASLGYTIVFSAVLRIRWRAGPYAPLAMRSAPRADTTSPGMSAACAPNAVQPVRLRIQPV
jgi:hypothetical protein